MDTTKEFIHADAADYAAADTLDVAASGTAGNVSGDHAGNPTQEQAALRILITGAKGQLGCELQRMLNCGYSELGPLPLVYRAAQVDAIDFDELDISDAAAVDAWFSSHERYDLVINGAAMTNVDACETHEAQAFAANALGPLNLARACARAKSTLLHTSTDYVFPGTVPNARVESDVPAPISAYGRTKLAGEALACANNPRTFVVRTAWLYGYVGHNFVKTMLRLATSHAELRVVNDQWGNPTSAVDLAHAILCLCTTDHYGIYHATCEGSCSWADFAATIMSSFHKDTKIIPCTSQEYKHNNPASADRPAYSSLENAGLKSLGLSCLRSWQDAFASYVHNYHALADKPIH